jgi:hypothetical protein
LDRIYKLFELEELLLKEGGQEGQVLMPVYAQQLA